MLGNKFAIVRIANHCQEYSFGSCKTNLLQKPHFKAISDNAHDINNL